MYGLRGDPVPDERLLQHLSGYRDSRPVRVGNAAKKQLQLDIYGETIDALYEMSRHGRTIPAENWEVVDHICDVWEEPDSGIWEVRSQP